MFKDLKHQNINCFNYFTIKHLPLSLLKDVSCSFLDRFEKKIDVECAKRRLQHLFELQGQ
jgi:hypothetical protein